MVTRKWGVAVALSSAVSVLVGMAQAAEPILLKGAEVSITAEEFRTFAKGALSEEQFAALGQNEQRGRELLGEFYVMRVLEHEARQQGMDKSPMVKLKLKQGEMRLLANERLQAIADAAPEPDFELLAREAYLAEREKFKVPEQVSVSHILIGINEKRDDAQALARAKEVLKKLKGGAEFAELAGEYSDDPSVAGNKGSMGYFPRGRMVKPFEDKAFAMSKEGELSEPVKSQFGYHIIRFDGRNPERTLAFDEVRAELIEQAEARFAGEIKRDKIAAIRTAGDINVDQEAVSAFFREQAEATQ